MEARSRIRTQESHKDRNYKMCSKNESPHSKRRRKEVETESRHSPLQTGRYILPAKPLSLGHLSVFFLLIFYINKCREIPARQAATKAKTASKRRFQSFMKSSKEQCWLFFATEHGTGGRVVYRRRHFIFFFPF
jgi:hypothetical protein